MLRFTWEQAAAWRVRRHYLDQRAPAGSVLSVASRLCGLHAQVLSSAELTLWARINDLDKSAVQRLLWEDRTLVKTWAMRGTLHLLPADELPLWHAALSTSPRYLKAAQWQKYFGITLEQLDELTEIIGNALHGRLLTREELAGEVRRISGSAELGTKLAQSSWGTMLRPAAFSGRLCFAPSVGQRVRFTHPNTWLAAPARKPKPRMDPEVAIPTVARRFLAAYGPASYHDLARWWNGGGISVARQWIRSLGEEVSAVDVDGTECWMLHHDTRELESSRALRSVRLLPAFDQYVIGASYHAQHLLPRDLRSLVYRAQGWISPVLLINGFMRGVWRHELKGEYVHITIKPFAKLPAWARAAASEEAARLARFLERDVRLTWSTSKA